MTHGRGSLLALVVLAATLGGAMAAVDAHGKAHRVHGPALPLGAGVAVSRVDSAEDAFRLWKTRGLRGRIVVSLSGRLYFVEPEVGLAPRSAATGRIVDPAAVAERDLGPMNFLWMAMERGIAREVRHVLPDAVFAQKADATVDDPLVEAAGDTLSAPHLGSPRLLSTLDGLRLPAEPVLLFVSASFFTDRGAADVARRLSSLGLVTDLVVLCRSTDDPEVTPLQRERLEDFAALLGAPP